jgi:hypothetical protein
MVSVGGMVETIAPKGDMTIVTCAVPSYSNSLES